MLQLALLSCRPLCFLAVFFAQRSCVGHEFLYGYFVIGQSCRNRFVPDRSAMISKPRLQTNKLPNYQVNRFLYAAVPAFASNAVPEQAASASHEVPPHQELTFSSCAYFSTSFFSPKRGNCTVSLASSPSPSR